MTTERLRESRVLYAPGGEARVPYFARLPVGVIRHTQRRGLCTTCLSLQLCCQLKINQIPYMILFVYHLQRSQGLTLGNLTEYAPTFGV